MFDAPVDSWYLWVGLASASVLLFGVVTGLPTAPPLDATGFADTVDTVAASQHTATATRSLAADEIRLGPNRVALRGGGGTAHATFVYGPVVPVANGTVLWEVAQGASPAHVFERPEAFRRAVTRAQNRGAEWRPADARLTVRTVTWEGTDVTLVDA